MEIRELRIGNYVGVSNLALNHLDKHPDNTFEIEQLRKDIVFFKGFHAGEYYHDLRPIPLTEEVFLKYGFYKTPGGCYQHKLINGWFTKYTEEKGLYSYHYNIFHICEFKYLHQLQNLVFTLSGQELEVKI